MICIGPMGRLAARVVAMGVAAAMVVGALTACGGDGDGDADAGPTASVPTMPPDPYAVPAVIDEAYVNRVLAALDQAVGDVVRMVVSTKTLSPEAIERLQAVYVGDALQQRFRIFQNDIFNGLTAFQPNPGNKKTIVAALLSIESSCVFAKVSRDFSEVSVQPDPRLATQWVALRLSDSATKTGRYNPTPWVVIYDGFPENHTEPPNPCVGT